MPEHFESHLSTGLAGLDAILKGVIPGDNIVWQVDTIDEYKRFVEPYAAFARSSGRDFIYFRFAQHEPLLDQDYGAEICNLNPQKGFEAFVNEIHLTIKNHGRGGYYVFDCLSQLADDWYSDQILGNFFMLTCPYLYDVEAVAYFALFKNYHSLAATSPVMSTTQVYMDVYHHENRIYIHPIKVQHRYSPSMYMLHVWQQDRFLPVTDSATISEVQTKTPRFQRSLTGYELGIWNRTFKEAEKALAPGATVDSLSAPGPTVFRRLIRMAITKDQRMSGMVEKYLTPKEILDICKRIIGTGLIGGKSVGMLLSRAILQKADASWSKLLEPHDSFYIGSDVFYTFLVHNGIWWERQRQKDPTSFLEGSERARQRMLVGTFPDYIEKQFSEILDYFGQSPFIVRSSSLLEDGFGNAFAGKYESVFCVNQGPRDKRLEDFKSAIKTIYAGAMSEKALKYRFQRGLLERDEQMSLLVQRVSGSFHDKIFTPQTAGVGFSFNPYVWSEYIDPTAGVLRLVFGLGTRAVEPRDDDYTRIVALNAPQRRPEVSRGEIRQYTQHKVDVLDLEANQLISIDFSELARRCPNLPLDLFSSKDRELEESLNLPGMEKPFTRILTFDRFLSKTNFVPDMRKILHLLQQAYDYPVDIEFTCNFFDDNHYKINLLQCRPFQVKGGPPVSDPPPNIAEADLILQAQGAVIGPSRISRIDRFVYVSPAVYSKMPVKDCYYVARLIGQLMHLKNFYDNKTIMLLGPGRWGTTTPSLGVPISFSDINTISILCEMVTMRPDLIPDVSLGTHLFSELVEMDILYLALFPHQQGNFLHERFFEQAPNKLTSFLPDAGVWMPVLRVIEPDQGQVILNANTLKQHVICYRQNIFKLQ